MADEQVDVGGALVAGHDDAIFMIRDPDGRYHHFGRLEPLRAARHIDTWQTGRPFFSDVSCGSGAVYVFSRHAIPLWSPLAVSLRRQHRAERHARRAQARLARAVRRLQARQRKRATRLRNRRQGRV